MNGDPFDALLALDAAAREHAARIPPPASRRESAPGVLRIRVAGREMLLPTAQVRTVQRCPALAPVPGARAWLAGMTAMDGRAVAVLDLAGFAFDTAAPATTDATLVLCAIDDERLGLLVDEVTGTAQATPPAAAAMDEAWLHDDGEHLHLEVDRLLAEIAARGAGHHARVQRQPPIASAPRSDVS